MTVFYSELYGRDRKAEVRTEEGERREENEEEDFPRILRWEVRREMKRSKRGEAPGPDNT